MQLVAIRRYRFKRRAQMVGACIGMLLIGFISARMYLSGLVGYGQIIRGGKVVGVQVVEVTGGKKEIWVFWARWGQVEIERREIPDAPGG